MESNGMRESRKEWEGEALLGEEDGTWEGGRQA